jgi:hypothetical protein
MSLTTAAHTVQRGASPGSKGVRRTIRDHRPTESPTEKERT